MHRCEISGGVLGKAVGFLPIAWDFLAKVHKNSKRGKSMVNHLINEHGKKNIAFVSGPKGNADAEERLAFYIEF